MIHTLSQSIEAILFAVSEPQTITSLAHRLNVDVEKIETAIEELAQALDQRGIMLVKNNQSVTLATRPEQHALIEALRKEELTKELSRASAETLAIIAYHPHATKAQIEFIRGVNASYSIRALQMRGLIEQVGNGRGVSYQLTMDTLRHFGVASFEELPHYKETKEKITTLLQREEASAS